MITQVTTCNRCRGEGTLIEAYCSECQGKGAIQRTRNIELKIPQGVDEGSQLRLPEEGESGGAGGQSGDLYVVVHMKPHSKFQRRGADLYATQELSFPQAVLGTKVDITTFDGTETVRIPEGTQTGDVFRIPRRGMPTVHGKNYGDLYVEVQVTTPKKVSWKAKKLIEELQKELEEGKQKY
jgi:molecular chaperone DnaJ